MKKIYPHRIWSIDTKEKVIYLTFDDGPHPLATPFVLDQLKKYNAKASFFCIGKNVAAYQQVYRRILDEGHRAGNHTYNHFNGWKTGNEKYLTDISAASQYIDSDLFRPPYGRLRSSQAKKIGTAMNNKSTKTVMWDVLSGDFDESLSKEQCLRNVLDKTVTGSIVVFHDSEKAFEKLQLVLPECLKKWSAMGYRFASL